MVALNYSSVKREKPRLQAHPDPCVTSTPVTAYRMSAFINAWKKPLCSSALPLAHPLCARDGTGRITIHPLPKHHSTGTTITVSTGNATFWPVPLRYNKCYFKELFTPCSVQWRPRRCCTKEVTLKAITSPLYKQTQHIPALYPHQPKPSS